MQRKVKTTSGLGVNLSQVELATNQMSDLDYQIHQLNQIVDELERKFTEGTIRRSDLDDLKEKADVFAQNILALQTCLGEIVQKSRKRGIRMASALLIPYFIFEGKVYAARLREPLVKAYEVTHYSDAVNRINWWLSPDQQQIQPHVYDLLAGVYLRCKSHEEANATSLERLIEGWNKGKIGSEARALAKKGYYVREKHRRAARTEVGRRPNNWELAKPGLDLVRGSSGPTFSKDPKTHEAMKREISNKGIRQPLPIIYLWVRQIPGDRDRCDAIAPGREEKDSGTYSGEIKAINIETPADVSKQPNRVYSRMIMPFAYGANRLQIFYQVPSDRKLKILWGKLPTWLQKRIELTVW